MSFSPNGYVKRAQECLRLARAARDDMVRNELLQLHQTYLYLARRLEEEVAPEPARPSSRRPDATILH